MCHHNRHIMGIVTLAIIFIFHGTSLALANDVEAVTDIDHQIPEFLFDCLTKKDPWIRPCNRVRRYLMIFDEHGNFFQEMKNRNDNSTYLSTSFMKTSRKPMGKQMKQGQGYPNYLFQLERADAGSFYIVTKSGQLLVAGSEISPSLLLREDHCSLGKDISQIIGNSSTSTTESPVTISSMDSPVTILGNSSTSTSESPVTISSTETSGTNASPESPVTAIAISTPPPSPDYGCDQSLWRLWKVDGRFLLIESMSKPGFFLNVESRSHNVRLGMEEKLTGIQTSFLSKIVLELTAGQPPSGIGADAYGDVVVHYVGRNGIPQSGYICDYEWGEKSADSVCKHFGYETGIPTYDGQYSSTITPEYVVSGLKCDNENLNECKFRTICGPTLSCMTQNSMKPFGGKGYACNRGSSTDVAGVVCGNQTQINNMLKEEITCDRASLDNDRKNVAAMFSIQKQMKTVSSTMFENKHWSEYLLPMPMAVSLMSALLLVSSQNDREIELVKPDQGHWDHLKYNYLQPNLLFLSQNVKENFLLSNANMGFIKVNTRTIHRNMKQALQNAFSKNKYDYKTLLPRNLRHIAEDAKTNKEKAEEVHTAFKNTNQIIDELLQGLKNTQGFQQNKNADAEKALEVLSSEYERDEKKLDENLKKKKEYDTKVKKSRKDFFDAAKAAMNAQCVDEVTECTSCALEVPQNTNKCKPGKTEKVCREFNDPICLDFEKVCKQGKSENVCREWNDPICLVEANECIKSEPVCAEWNDPTCLVDQKECTGGWTDEYCRETESVCVARFIACIAYEDQCISWESSKCRKYEKICKQKSDKPTCKRWEDKCKEYGKFCKQSSPDATCKRFEIVCHEYEQICKQNAPYATCRRWEVLCHEYVYEPTVRGSYCQDNDKRGKLCARCKWIDEVSKNLENVADLTLKMQNSVLNDESSYSAVEGVITELVSHVNVIDQDVQMYKKWKAAYQIVPPIDNSTQATNNGSQLVDNATRNMNNESKLNKLELEAKRNIDSTLKLTKLSIDMVIDLLSQEKIPIARKSHSFAKEFRGLLEYLITRKVTKVGDLSEKEQISITTLFTKGKALLQEAIELKEKHEISIAKQSGGAADHKTGELAANHLDYLTKQQKTEKVIESLSNRMSTGIREMFKQELITQDINSIIKKLVECSRYLNFLSEQWVELRIFFNKLSDFLEIMQKRIKRMSEFYLDMGVKVDRSKLTKAFKENLQREIVDALANNIYVGRIASYYTKIAEGGLLQRMASIGNYLGKIKDPLVLERLKKYIEDESIMTQDRIKAEVSKEEAKINDAIMKDVSSMKNDLACKLKDAANLSNETMIALKSIKEAQNDQQNEETTILTSSPADIDKMNFFDDTPVGLNARSQEIDSNIITFTDDEADYFF